MKLKAILGCIVVIGILLISSPVLALSIGVSPIQIELEVPSGGSTTVDVKIHYFDGDVQISLIDIPLRIEPEVISVEASESPVEVELTIYGDSSLGSKIYDGYIRFIAVSGGAATGGVQVIAKITNIVGGETPVLVSEEEVVSTDLVEEVEKTTEEEEQEEVPILYWGEEEAPQVSETKPFPTLLVAGIASGTAIVMTLIIVIAKSRRYQY